MSSPLLSEKNPVDSFEQDNIVGKYYRRNADLFEEAQRKMSRFATFLMFLDAFFTNGPLIFHTPVTTSDATMEYQVIIFLNWRCERIKSRAYILFSAIIKVRHESIGNENLIIDSMNDELMTSARGTNVSPLATNEAQNNGQRSETW